MQDFKYQQKKYKWENLHKSCSGNPELCGMLFSRNGHLAVLLSTLEMQAVTIR